MISEPYYQIIKTLASGAVCEEKINGKLSQTSCKYLLAQVIRQYSVPEDHYLISSKAKLLWKKLADEAEKIEKCHYKERVKCKFDGEIGRYVGNEKKPRLTILKRGEKFFYRDFFHNEHIVPISDIVDQILIFEEKHKLNEQKIQDLLNKIYICRITKEEDRSINKKYHRGLDCKEILEKVYKPAGITISNS